jgi:putative metal-binding protein
MTSIRTNLTTEGRPMNHTSTRVPSVLGALAAVTLLLGSTPGRAQPLFDHMKCVTVRDSLVVKGKVDLEALRADFGLEAGCRISKTGLLCTPVAKTVVESNLPPIPGSTGEPLTGDLICYKAACPRDPTPTPAQIRGDQFGTHELVPKKTKWLCAPSGTNCTPTAEICDGLDNDCDGTADDLPDITCGVGACESTVAACVGGVPQTCTPGTPGTEICNGDDDDCDGAVDEDIPDETCGVGQCEVTVPACLNGTPQTCTPRDPSPVEICDGKDNDCDGAVDEDLGGPVTCGVGECEVTVPTGCDNGVPKQCTPNAPGVELCDNDQDENCNLLVDECGCICPAGTADCVDASNGCETNILTDEANCGSCGHACAAMQTCNGGTCQ